MKKLIPVTIKALFVDLTIYDSHSDYIRSFLGRNVYILNEKNERVKMGYITRVQTDTRVPYTYNETAIMEVESGFSYKPGDVHLATPLDVIETVDGKDVESLHLCLGMGYQEIGESFYEVPRAKLALLSVLNRNICYIAEKLSRGPDKSVRAECIAHGRWHRVTLELIVNDGREYLQATTDTGEQINFDHMSMLNTEWDLPRWLDGGVK